MTQAQLDRAVARRTGESLRTVRSLGFHAQAGPPAGAGPGELHLAVACPGCGEGRPLPARIGGPPEMAECARCDIYFDYAPDAVHARVFGAAPRREGPGDGRGCPGF